MRKNIQSVINAFCNNKAHYEATCSTDGTRIYSYSMLIAERHLDGVWIVSESESPSKTTTSQIRAIRSMTSHLA